MSQCTLDHCYGVLTLGNSSFVFPGKSRKIWLPLLCVLPFQFFRLQTKGFVGMFSFFAMQRKINRDKTSGIAITHDQTFESKAISMVYMIKYFGYSFDKFASFKTAGIINNKVPEFIRRLTGSFVNQGKKAINKQKHHHTPIYPGIILH